MGACFGCFGHPPISEKERIPHNVHILPPPGQVVTGYILFFYRDRAHSGAHLALARCACSNLSGSDHDHENEPLRSDSFVKNDELLITIRAGGAVCYLNAGSYYEPVPIGALVICDWRYPDFDMRKKIAYQPAQYNLWIWMFSIFAKAVRAFRFKNRKAPSIKRGFSPHHFLSCLWVYWTRSCSSSLLIYLSQKRN